MNVTETASVIVPFPEHPPAGYQWLAGEPPFDPDLHLALEPPGEMITFAELGYPDAEIEPTATPVAVSAPFRVLSDEGGAVMPGRMLPPPPPPLHPAHRATTSTTAIPYRTHGRERPDRDALHVGQGVSGLGVPRPRPGDLRDRAGKAGEALAGRGHPARVPGSPSASSGASPKAAEAPRRSASATGT